MAVTAEYREFVLDQLRAVVPVSAKAMFGGVGIYSDKTFFALIADDAVYFKVDATTRGAYWELPADVLENEDELRAWTRAALKVARKK